MCAIESKPKDFVWAHSKDANLKEPIQALKEKGWEYGDIPTASNFNWLFNSIMNQVRIVSAAIEEFEAKNIDLQETLYFVIKNTELLVEKSNEHRTILKNICRKLPTMEHELKKHIPSYKVEEIPAGLGISLPIPTKPRTSEAGTDRKVSGT